LTPDSRSGEQKKLSAFHGFRSLLHDS
jgi:hypothetical protein